MYKFKGISQITLLKFGGDWILSWSFRIWILPPKIWGVWILHPDILELGFFYLKFWDCLDFTPLNSETLGSKI